MIIKLIPGLEINEKDNLTTSVAKGMAEGALNGAIVTLGLAGIVYLVGKTLQVKEEIQEELAE